MLRAMITRALLLALGTMLVPSWVSADVAPPEPGDIECPRGAIGTLPTVRPDAMDPRGRPIRPWPYCAPSTCASDADCSGGRICSAEEIGLCVEDHEVAGGDPVRNARARGCEPDNSCLNIESSCERARRCVMPEAGPAAAPEPVEAEAAEAAPGEVPSEAPAASPVAETASGCACRATARGGRSVGWLALLPLALIIARRRAR